MALLRNIIGEYRGSVGGQTFSRNAAGMFVRQRITPVQPNTPEQLRARGDLLALTQFYATLDERAQSKWREFAIANPIKNKFGELITLNAIAMFMYVNGRRKLFSETIVDDPPEDLLTYDFDSLGTGTAIEQIPDEMQWKFSWSVTSPYVDIYSYRVLMFMTTHIPGTKQSYQNLLRLLKVSGAQTTKTANYTIGDEYTNKFGNPPDGSYIGAGMILVNPVNGIRSVWYKQMTGYVAGSP